MGKTSFAGRFMVGTRIYTGFAVVLILLALVAVIGIRGFGSVDITSGRYEAIAENLARGLEIQRDVANMRRNVRLYGMTGEEQYLATAHENMKVIADTLGSLADKTTDPTHKLLIQNMNGQFAGYRADFAKAVEARRERDKIVNKELVPIGSAMSDALRKLMRDASETRDFEAGNKAGLVAESLLRLRYAIVKFLGSPDAKIVPQLKADTDAFVKSTNGLSNRFVDPAQKRLADEVDANAEKYLARFEDAVAVILTADDLINIKLSGRAKQFAQEAAKLGDSQRNAMQAAAAESESTMGLAVSLETWIAAGALVFGLVFAWLIARSITGPVVSMTETMTRLAAGNLGVDVPALGHKDEIGRMAQAVEVFKKNAVEKVRMDEAEKQRLEAERQAVEAQRQRELVVGKEIATLIEAVSKGDLDSRLDLDDKDGFYRTMSAGINRLTDTVQAAIIDIAWVLGALAEGDLSQRITKEYQGAFDRLKSDVNATSSKLGEIVGQIGEATEAMSQAANEVSAGSGDLAERTEQQASSLEETAASMEELGATVRTSAENAQRANRMAGDARGAGEQGGIVAASAIDAMKSIAEASRKITDIIGVIDEIAFQTNLLALNAAVEAARAGDAGKGFAVVAQEVRVLAQRSAQASKEIKALILNSDNQVRDGVEMVRKAGDSLNGIVQGVQQVAALIGEIAGASAEQASALDEINSAVASMDEMTQKNAALVEETSAAAQSMSGQASELRTLMAFFKTDGRAQSPAPGLGGGDHRHGASARAVVPTRPVSRPATKAPHKLTQKKAAGGALRHAAGAGGDEWKEF
ncbi:MAG: methyl-accepting chemotaxis protein [Rhodospirillaceae bacterium]